MELVIRILFDSWRILASRVCLLPIWIDVMIVATLVWRHDTQNWLPLLVVGIPALAATAAVRYAGAAPATRTCVAFAAALGPVVLVHGGWAPLPFDAVLYASALVAAFIAYADWRPIVLGAALAIGTAPNLDGALTIGPIIALEALVLILIVARLCAAAGAQSARFERLDAQLAHADAELERLSAAREQAAADCSKAAIRIDHLANHDSTTSLPNRALMMERLRVALAEAEHAGGGVLVLYLDLADLKVINDTTGHESGDRALAIIAARLRSCLRSGDLASRVGGDEFVLVCTTTGGANECAQIAQRLMTAVCEPIAAGSALLHLGSNIGISSAPTDGNDAEDLIHKAEAAMYHAKEAGINNFHLYTPAIHAELLDRSKLRRELEDAIVRDEFVVHYQPIVSLTSRGVIGAEALVRWMHPTRGLLAPGEFIAFAEAHGLITAIGEAVMQKACAQVNRFALQTSDEFTMAVNVSALQFRAPGFVEGVAHLLAGHGLDSSRLEIEITESVIMDDATSVVRTLHQLDAHGVRLSIDDFGTGYSSLAYVKHFPVHTLKIDRSFVIDLAENPTDQAIAATIITLAHNLGMRVIAEGIETQDQLERLRMLGADDMQGYLVSRPLPADEFERFICSFGRLKLAA